MLAGSPSWPASSSYGTSGSTRRAVRRIALDRPGRPQHVDRVVALAAGHDEPVMVGQDDVGLVCPGPRAGRPAPARRQPERAGEPGLRPVPPAAADQHQLRQEGRRDQQANGQQQGLQPLRHALAPGLLLSPAGDDARCQPAPTAAGSGAAGGPGPAWAVTVPPGAGSSARCRGGSRPDRGRCAAGWPRTGPASRRARKGRPRSRPRCHRPRPCSGRESSPQAAPQRCRGGSRPDRGRCAAGWPRTGPASRRARRTGRRFRPDSRRAARRSWRGNWSPSSVPRRRSTCWCWCW